MEEPYPLEALGRSRPRASAKPRREYCPCCGRMMSVSAKIMRGITEGVEDLAELRKLVPANVPRRDVYTALANLVRRKRIKRIGLGRYVPIDA